MELVLSRPGMMRAFKTEWRVKWVPAIIAYSRGLKKKEIAQLFAKRNTDALGECLCSSSSKDFIWGGGAFE